MSYGKAAFSERFEGLWLLDTAALDALDDIVDRFCGDHADVKRVLEIPTEKEKTIVFDAFRHAFNDPRLKPFKPNAFSYSARTNEGIIRVSLALGERLTLFLDPADHNAARTQNTLTQWAENSRESQVAHLWSEWWVPACFVVFFCWMGFVSTLDNSSKAAVEAARRAEATAVLGNGSVSDANRDKAIEFLVRASGGLIQVPRESQNFRALVGLSIAGAVCLFLAMHPRSMVAVGGGKSAIKWQQYRVEYLLKKFLFGFVVLGILSYLVKMLIAWMSAQAK